MRHLLTTFIIICSFFLFENITYSQNTDDPKTKLTTWIDSQFTAGLDSFNIAGATFVLMQGDSILHLKGYGLADIESNTPVNGSSSIFGIGSISKTFVATAILQLYEDGKLELDRDVNSYLTSFQLAYKFNDSITVRHLLTHTAGIEDRIINTTVRSEKDVISLAQYIKTRMTQQIRPAGVALTYSNHGYTLLGLIVEDVSGLPFHEYAKQHILKPLEMKSSGFKKQDELKENYVTSYRFNGEELIRYKPDFILEYPSGALNATASDMGNYISMFLNNGNFKGDQILDSTTIAKIRHEPFRHYEKAEYGWLMGFQEMYWNGVQIYGHAGSIQGFKSLLLLIPEKNIGFFISANSWNISAGTTGIFIKQFTDNFLSRLIPKSIVEKKKAKDKPTIGFVDEPLERFTGTYRSTRHAYTTISKLAILVESAFEFEVVSDDSTLKIVESNNKLTPISDLTFYSENNYYVAFGRDIKGDISYLFINAHSYNKLKWYEPVKFQLFWVGGIVLILLIYIIVSAVRKLFIRNKKSHLIKTINCLLASLIVLFIAVIAFGLTKMDPQEFYYGLPFPIKVALLIPILIIPLELYSIYLLVKAIRFKELGTLDLIYQSISVVAALLFIPWLMYYNLIGFNY